MTDGVKSVLNVTRLAGSLAVAFSVFLHMALFRLNPSLMLGGGQGFSSPERTLSFDRLSVDTLDIRRETVLSADADLYDRIEEAGFEGSASGDLDDSLLGGDDFMTDVAELDTMAETLPVFPETFPGPLPVERSGEDPGWHARAEVLAIREQRVRERVESQPRRIVPRVEREAQVTDFVPHVGEDLPGDAETQSAAWAGELSFEPGSGLEEAGRDVTGHLDDLRTLQRSGGGGGAEVRPERRSTFSDVEEVFEHTAQVADQFLRLTAQTYVDPVRPAYRYFKVQLRPSGLEDLKVLPRELFFLVDGSARIPPEAFRQAGQALGNVLGMLHPEDRFNLFLLQEETVRLFEESQPATPMNVARVRGRLAQTRPRGSGDLLTGLDMLLEPLAEPGRVRIGIVMTDGVPALSVEESSGFIERFTRKNQGETSVFTVGVGRRVNRYLLDFLSFQNRGDSLVTEQILQSGEALRRTLAGVDRPVLRHLRYRFVGGDAYRVYPQSLTHLYLDRPLILVGRVPADQQTLTFQIVGYSHEGAHDMIYTLDVDRMSPGPWSIRQDWAWQALLNEVGVFLQTGDPERMSNIQTLSKAYGISPPYPLTP